MLCLLPLSPEGSSRTCQQQQRCPFLGVPPLDDSPRSERAFLNLRKCDRQWRVSLSVVRVLNLFFQQHLRPRKEIPGDCPAQSRVCSPSHSPFPGRRRGEPREGLQGVVRSQYHLSTSLPPGLRPPSALPSRLPCTWFLTSTGTFHQNYNLCAPRRVINAFHPTVTPHSNLARGFYYHSPPTGEEAEGRGSWPTGKGPCTRLSSCNPDTAS